MNTQLQAKNIPFVPHFFVDTSNAPSDVIAATISKVARPAILTHPLPQPLENPIPLKQNPEHYLWKRWTIKTLN